MSDHHPREMATLDRTRLTGPLRDAFFDGVVATLNTLPIQQALKSPATRRQQRRFGHCSWPDPLLYRACAIHRTFRCARLVALTNTPRRGIRDDAAFACIPQGVLQQYVAVRAMIRMERQIRRAGTMSAVFFFGLSILGLVFARAYDASRLENFPAVCGGKWTISGDDCPVLARDDSRKMRNRSRRREDPRCRK